MNWRYKIEGSHTRVRVFMNGGKCGDLCFRNDEFVSLRIKFAGDINFINEGSEEGCTPGRKGGSHDP